jgi:hypothetical protein
MSWCTSSGSNSTGTAAAASAARSGLSDMRQGEIADRVDTTRNAGEQDSNPGRLGRRPGSGCFWSIARRGANAHNGR